jgi:hypothetical protein
MESRKQRKIYDWYQRLESVFSYLVPTWIPPRVEVNLVIISVMTVASPKEIASVGLFQLKSRLLAMAGIARGLCYSIVCGRNTILYSLRK